MANIYAPVMEYVSLPQCIRTSALSEKNAVGTRHSGHRSPTGQIQHSSNYLSAAEWMIVFQEEIIIINLLKGPNRSIREAIVGDGG